MKVLSIQRADVGGAAYRLELIANKAGIEFERWQVHSLDLGFPAGRMITPNNTADLLRSAETADIIHLHTAAVLQQWGPKFPNRRMVCTLHGVESIGAISIKARQLSKILGVKLVVVTPNLLEPFPEATLIPNGVLPEMENFGAPIWPKKPTLVCSHSYVKEFKSHDVRDRFIRDTRVHAEFWDTFVPNIAWRNNHVRKAGFVWDHFQGYWGQSTLEGWWLGTIPIVCPDIESRQRATEFGGELPPFGPPTYREWVDLVRSCIDDPDRMKREIDVRRDFVERKWNSEILAETWKRLYLEL